MGLCLFTCPPFVKNPELFPLFLKGRYEWDVSYQDVQKIGIDSLETEREFNWRAGVWEEFYDIPEFMREEPFPPRNSAYDISMAEMQRIWKVQVPGNVFESTKEVTGMELKDLVAIITGGGKGIGRAIAESFFKEGAWVALWDIDLRSTESVIASLDPSGRKTMAIRVDITNETEVTNAVSEVVSKFNRIDILVNNAGISRHKPIEEMTLQIFESVMKVNLTGTFLCCRTVTPIMKKQGRGKIVNIASLGGRTGRPGVGVNYAASKAGVIGLTQTLARELGPEGIYVNAIAPGPILTEQIRQYPPEVFAKWNVGRAVEKEGLPEDVADVAIFLASRRSDWVTGVTVDVNGGILIR
jgi:3-oxoacyl-[acyl-carrier protein] reductase